MYCSKLFDLVQPWNILADVDLLTSQAQFFSQVRSASSRLLMLPAVKARARALLVFPENMAFYMKQDFLFHIDWYHFYGPSSSKSKEPRFRLLEIKANAVIYTHPKLSNELGFWRRQPRLVTYVTEISLLWSLVASQQLVLSFWAHWWWQQLLCSLQNFLLHDPQNQTSDVKNRNPGYMW